MKPPDDVIDFFNRIAKQINPILEETNSHSVVLFLIKDNNLYAFQNRTDELSYHQALAAIDQYINERLFASSPAKDQQEINDIVDSIFNSLLGVKRPLNG